MVLGIDLLFDVEKEDILYIEESPAGGIPFLQWQQKNHKK